MKLLYANHRWILFVIVTASWNVAFAQDVTPLTESDFKSIFNGRDLTGWTGDTKHWSVDNGILACEHAAGNLFTDREYADFVLRFDVRLSEGANNGIGLRAPLGAKWVSSEGMEIQILDEGVKEHRDLKPYQFHGSVYGVVPAKRGALKSIGEWNEQEIRCVDSKIAIVLNGTKILDANLDDYEVDPAPDGFARHGVKRQKGHLALLGHTNRAEFRNLRVYELPATKTPKP